MSKSSDKELAEVEKNKFNYDSTMLSKPSVTQRCVAADDATLDAEINALSRAEPCPMSTFVSAALLMNVRPSVACICVRVNH